MRSKFSRHFVFGAIVGILCLAGCQGPSEGEPTPESPKLAIINLSPAAAFLERGKTQAFMLTGIYSDASTQDLSAQASWSVVDPSVSGAVTVDATGLVAGLAVGTATLRASYLDKTATAAVQVTVPPLTSISLSPTATQLALGTSIRLSAMATYADGEVVDITKLSNWISEDVTGSAVAVVSNAGVTKGNSAGEALITASYQGKSGSTTLTVKNLSLSALTIAPSTTTVAKGLELQYRATADFSDGSRQDLTDQVAWSASDVLGTGVASIDSVGRVQAKKAGQARISALFGSLSKVADLTVVDGTLDSISISPQTASITLGSAQRFTATATFSEGSQGDVTDTAVWSAVDLSGRSVTSVDRGLATGQAIGQATVSAAYGGKTAMATLTVKGLSSISVTPTTATVLVGSGQSFVAEGTLSDGSKQDLTSFATWSSSDKSIATINTAGQATAVKSGQVTITAAYQGKMGTAALTIQGWSPVASGVTDTLKDVWASAANDAWAVGVDSGGKGVLLRWDGVSWTNKSSTLPAGTTALSSLWGSAANDVWAVGAQILHWDGAAWTIAVPSSGNNLAQVFGTGTADVWAAGSDAAIKNGVLLHWNGTAWSPVSTGLTLAPIQGLWAGSAKDVWLSGTRPSATPMIADTDTYHFDGTAWTAIRPYLLAEPLSGISGSGAGDLWILMHPLGIGSVTHIDFWDGAKWGIQSSFDSLLYKIWGSSGSKVWAVGDAIVRWNGTAWSMFYKPTSTLNSVFGSSANDVWAVGKNGLILRFR